MEPRADVMARPHKIVKILRNGHGFVPPFVKIFDGFILFSDFTAAKPPFSCRESAFSSSWNHGFIVVKAPFQCRQTAFSVSWNHLLSSVQTAFWERSNYLLKKFKPPFDDNNTSNPLFLTPKSLRYFRAGVCRWFLRDSHAPNHRGRS